jgi:pimeloyl-ACP methyl ester carboxylesterase
MRILFIRGFNTDLNDKKKHNSGKYDNFDKELTYDVITYFNYGPNEHIKNVFERLNQILSIQNNYNVIVAHSMGACLLTKYLHLNPEYGCTNVIKIILIAPFLVKNKKYEEIINPIFMKFFIIPNFLISKKVNTELVNFKQIHQIYKKKYGFFLNEETLIHLINSHPSLHIVYSKDENITVIPNDILDKMKNVIYVEGGHCAFEDKKYMDAFFNIFVGLLQKEYESESDSDSDSDSDNDSDSDISSITDGNTTSTTIDSKIWVVEQPEHVNYSNFKSYINDKKDTLPKTPYTNDFCINGWCWSIFRKAHG